VGSPRNSGALSDEPLIRWAFGPDWLFGTVPTVSNLDLQDIQTPVKSDGCFTRCPGPAPNGNSCACGLNRTACCDPPASLFLAPLRLMPQLRGSLWSQQAQLHVWRDAFLVSTDAVNRPDTIPGPIRRFRFANVESVAPSLFLFFCQSTFRSRFFELSTLCCTLRHAGLKCLPIDLNYSAGHSMKPFDGCQIPLTGGLFWIFAILGVSPALGL